MSREFSQLTAGVLNLHRSWNVSRTRQQAALTGVAFGLGKATGDRELGGNDHEGADVGHFIVASDDGEGSTIRDENPARRRIQPPGDDAVQKRWEDN